MFTWRCTLTLLAVALAACTAGRSSGPEPFSPDYILHNGKILTVDGAFTIARATYADLVVLSADYLTVPESAIPSIKPLATMVGGKFVYTDPGWRP